MWWTGARPSEILQLTRSRLDVSGDVWLFRPARHKGVWQGKERAIAIGPRGQQVLRPLLKLDADAAILSPRDALAEIKAEKRAARKSPMTPSQRARDARNAAKEPPVGEFYDMNAYRKAIHRADLVEKIVDALNRDRPDHLIITGDVTNLALEAEFEYAARVLSRLALPPSAVSMVPGNHDTYTRGSHKVGRFGTYLGHFATSDVHVSGDALFPFIRLRGPVAIVGLSSAVPRPPLVASGELGETQLGALRRALAHPEVAARTPVVLVHHPVHNPPSKGRFLRPLGLPGCHDFAGRTHPRPAALSSQKRRSQAAGTWIAAFGCRRSANCKIR